ncbi:MAG: Rrf2 family transcriptional regulator [Myxococcales bacterium]|nr:Rrf2 family transcriptional regulator [Myxococcales bacterium]MCB9714236.1 Rrf2 family transcriptional regulator [Myxococcales bacterium]
MRLTKHSDYALRVLLYVAAAPGRQVSTEEIGAAYGISTHHLFKVVGKLGKHGLLSIKRGRGGGMELGRPAAEIRIGDVVMLTEPDFALVECLEEGNDNCPLTGACALVPPLVRARKAFVAVLNEYTLADAVGPRNEARYRRLLQIAE